MNTARKIVLRFPPRLVDQPIIYRLVKDYDLQFNILKASITPNEEGILVLELAGKKKDYDEAIRFLHKLPVDKFRPFFSEVLVLMKCLAGRPQDDQDITGIVAAQSATLDWEYCEDVARQLEEAVGMDLLAKIRALH